MLRLLTDAASRARSHGPDSPTAPRARWRRGGQSDILEYADAVLADAQLQSTGPFYLGKDDYPKVIHLNVGGKKFMTTLPTLQSREHSKLSDMFSGECPVHRDADGTFFIDRDGEGFSHILNFLRDSSVPIGLTQMQRLHLLRETKFYGLDVLHAILGGVQAPHDHSQETLSWRARKNAQQAQHGRSSIHGVVSDLFQMSLLETFDFVPRPRQVRMYARLRHGHEYPGDPIVSSPRSLPGVQYELYEATLGRDLIPAMNKMMNAGFQTCVNPPVVPKLQDYHTDTWQLMMYRDVPLCFNNIGQEVLDHPIGSASAFGSASASSQCGVPDIPIGATFGSQQSSTSLASSRPTNRTSPGGSPAHPFAPAPPAPPQTINL